MPSTDPYLAKAWLSLVFFAACEVCLIVWIWLAWRAYAGEPLLKYQPHRPVPWRPFDLLIVLVLYLALQATMIFVLRAYLGPEITTPPVMYDVERASAAHMVARLLRENDLRILISCVVAAVLVAPVVEEFLFRVVLQGYLQAALWRWRKLLPTLRMLMPGALGPILLTSLLFARMHFRVETPMLNVWFLASLLAGNAVAGLLTTVCAIAILRSRTGATAFDFGWVGEKFLADAVMGFVAFLAIAAPIYLVQLGLSQLLPKYLAADPFALFLLSIVLGTLYAYTHRIVPAIVVHMSLNAASLALAWFMLHG